MRTLAALFRRRPEAPDPQEAIRVLQVERCRDREHIVRLESMLRAEARRADQAERALAQFRRDINAGHNALARRVNELQRENGQLRTNLDHAMYDDKTLATINAGGISKVTAA